MEMGAEVLVMDDAIAAALGRLSYGVYLIGVKTAKRMNAMTAAWATQVSGRPPLVLVAVNKAHYTSELIPEAGSFSLNVLRPDQFELAKRCGFGSGRNKDRLIGVPLIFAETSAPILADCAAYLDCRLAQSYEVGDHLLFVGEVVAAGDSGKPVLAYEAERFFG